MSELATQDRLTPGQQQAAKYDVPTRAAVEALRETGRYFHGRGWSLGTSSNYSVVLSRNPFRLLITASGKDKSALGEHDFVIVDEMGKPTDPAMPKPSAETLLHVRAAAVNPGIGSVLHTHSVSATVLSDLYPGGFDISQYEMLKGLAGVTTHDHTHAMEVIENTQDIATLAQQLEPRWKPGAGKPLVHGFILRKHGLYTWGANLDEARRHVEIFEFLFDVVLRTLPLRAGGTLPLK